MMSMPSKRKEPVPSPPARENSLTIFYMLPETMEIKAISRQLQCDIEESIEYILQVWLLYVSIKILLSFSYPTFFQKFLLSK